MVKYLEKMSILRRFCLILITLCFTGTSIMPLSYAQTPVNPFSYLNMPVPGVMIEPTEAFTPVMMQAVRIFPEEPLRFDFVMDKGQNSPSGRALQDEYTKIIKYFLASLTVPDEDMWVNLSPDETERVIPEAFGLTEMGRDLLAQDYILKQLTASLLHPEKELGKTFWDRIYAKLRERMKAGSDTSQGEDRDIEFDWSNIGINAFHRVWIVPDEAAVYVHENVAFVTKSRLKVMLAEDYENLRRSLAEGGMEEDYLAAQNDLSQGHKVTKSQKNTCDSVTCDSVTSKVMREVILPELEREVNEGKHFATLRQVYHSLILATWFKRNLKKSFLGEVYVGREKINGVDVADRAIKNKIYQQYLAAFQQGVFNFIKEDYDGFKGEVVPRQYFSGGMNFPAQLKDVYTESPEGPDQAMLAYLQQNADIVSTDLAVAAVRENAGRQDSAMLTAKDAVDFLPRQFYEGVNKYHFTVFEALTRALTMWIQGGGSGDPYSIPGMDDLMTYISDQMLDYSIREKEGTIVLTLDDGRELPLVLYDQDWAPGDAQWLLTDPEGRDARLLVEWAEKAKGQFLTDLIELRSENDDSMKEVSRFLLYFEKFLAVQEAHNRPLTEDERSLLEQIQIVPLVIERQGGYRVDREDLDVYGPEYIAYNSGRAEKRRILLWSFRDGAPTEENFIRGDGLFGFYRIFGGDMTVLIRTPKGIFQVKALGWPMIFSGMDRKRLISFRVTRMDREKEKELMLKFPPWKGQTDWAPETLEALKRSLQTSNFINFFDDSFLEETQQAFFDWLLRDPFLKRVRSTLLRKLEKIIRRSSNNRAIVLDDGSGREIVLFGIGGQGRSPELLFGTDYLQNSRRIIRWAIKMREEVLKDAFTSARIKAVPISMSTSARDRMRVSRFLSQLDRYLFTKQQMNKLNDMELDFLRQIDIQPLFYERVFYNREKAQEESRLVSEYGDIEVRLNEEKGDEKKTPVWRFFSSWEIPDAARQDEQFGIYRLVNEKEDTFLVRVLDRVYRIAIEDKGDSAWKHEDRKSDYEFNISLMDKDTFEYLETVALRQQAQKADYAMLAGREVVADAQSGVGLIMAKGRELEEWKAGYEELKEEFASLDNAKKKPGYQQLMEFMLEKMAYDFEEAFEKNRFQTHKNLGRELIVSYADQRELFKGLFANERLMELVSLILEETAQRPDTDSIAEALQKIELMQKKQALPGISERNVLKFFQYWKTTQDPLEKKLGPAFVVMRYLSGGQKEALLNLLNFLYQFMDAEDQDRLRVLQAFRAVREKTGRLYQYVMMDIFPKAVGFRIYRSVEKGGAKGETADFSGPAYFNLNRGSALLDGLKDGEGDLIITHIPLEKIRGFNPGVLQTHQEDREAGRILISSGQYVLETEKSAEESVRSNPKKSARVKASGPRETGGIDFNPQTMDLRSYGENFDFSIPAALEGTDPDAIPGFTPVILNIVPAVNLPLFLGIADEIDFSQRLS